MHLNNILSWENILSVDKKYLVTGVTLVSAIIMDHRGWRDMVSQTQLPMEFGFLQV